MLDNSSVVHHAMDAADESRARSASIEFTLRHLSRLMSKIGQGMCLRDLSNSLMSGGIIVANNYAAFNDPL